MAIDPQQVANMAAALQQQQQLNAQLQQQMQQVLQAQAQLAAAAQAQQAQGHAGAGRLKAPTPPTFRGEMLAVDAFIRAQKQQHAFYGADLATDAAKLRFVAVHLADGASQWFETQQAGQTPITTWAEFEERFHKRYRPVKAEMAARQRLSQLEQRGTTSVNVYASLFQAILSPITDMSEKDKLFSFVRGLRPEIKMRMWDKEITTLAEAINCAVSVEAMMAFGRTGTMPHGFGGGRGHMHGHGSAGANNAASSSSSSGVHMDLSNMSLGDEHASEMDAFAQYSLGERAESSASDHAAAASAMVALNGKIQALEHRLQNLTFTPGPRSDRVPGLKAEDVKKLMKEGRCFRCKKT